METQRWRNLPEVTWLESSRTGIWTEGSSPHSEASHCDGGRREGVGLGQALSLTTFGTCVEFILEVLFGVWLILLLLLLLFYLTLTFTFRPIKHFFFSFLRWYLDTRSCASVAVTPFSTALHPWYWDPCQTMSRLAWAGLEEPRIWTQVIFLFCSCSLVVIIILIVVAYITELTSLTTFWCRVWWH